MNSEVVDRLTDIELAYCEGAKFEKLSDMIVEAAALIAALEEGEPARALSETYAPMLWGEASGSVIDTRKVKAALAGSNGATHLRSWSGLGHAIAAYEAAAAWGSDSPSGRRFAA